MNYINCNAESANDLINVVNVLITTNFKNGCPVCVLDINTKDNPQEKYSIVGFLVLDSKENVKSVVAHTDGIEDDSPLIALFGDVLAKNTEFASVNGLVYKLSDCKVKKLIKDALSDKFSKSWTDYGTLMTSIVA